MPEWTLGEDGTYRTTVQNVRCEVETDGVLWTWCVFLAGAEVEDFADTLAEAQAAAVQEAVRGHL